MTYNIIESTLHIGPIHNLGREVGDWELPCDSLTWRFRGHVWNIFVHSKKPSGATVIFRLSSNLFHFVQDWNKSERVAEACVPRRMLCLSRRRCRVIRLLEHEGSLTFLYSLECEPRAVVRVRVRRNVVRVRVNEAAIRIRIVVRTANDTAPGTRYLFEFIPFCCLLSLCLPEIDHLKQSISLWVFPFSRFRLFQMYPQQSQYPH